MGVASAIGLYILVSIFSSGTESSARFKILAIAFGALIIQSALPALIPGLAGQLAGLVASLGMIAAALIFWCGVERKPALKITGSYFALCVALSVLFAVLQKSS